MPWGSEVTLVSIYYIVIDLRLTFLRTYYIITDLRHVWPMTLRTHMSHNSYESSPTHM